MAKPKKVSKSAAKVVKKKDDEITISLDSFGVPIAIVIAGIVIALAIFFTNNRANKNNVDTTKNDNTATQNDDTQPGAKATGTIGNAPYIGDKSKAKVAIIEYSDFGCGYCARHASQVFPELKKNYVDTGKVIYVFKSFPLSSSGASYNTAVAAPCVYEQVGGEKFAQFHSEAFTKKTDAEVRSLALSYGVDGGKYDTCLSDKKYEGDVTAERTEGSNAGISGTPGFSVGVIGDDGKVTGELIKGAYPLETFDAAIARVMPK